MKCLTTVSDTAARLENRKTSSEAITRTILSEIEENNDQWKIFAQIFKERAINAAAQSDARRGYNQSRGLLDGVPLAVKDNLHLQGYPTVAGTGHDFSGGFGRTASVVQRLQNAGAVVIGSCTMDEAALGATTNNPHTGQCVNPVKPGCTPGGSSGGSAAAVAAGWVAASIGTDTLGSVRIPAAYCHLWGIKPTHNSVPASGLVPLCPHLDSVGALAHSAEDLITILSSISNNNSPGEIHGQNNRKVNVGVASDLLLSSCDTPVADSFEAFVNHSIGEYAHFACEHFEFWNPGQLRRDGLLLTEVQASQSFKRELAENPHAFSKSFHAMMQYGRSVADDRLKLSVERIMLAKEQTDRLFNKYDYLLVPTAPQLAFSTDCKAPDNQADFTALASVTGCPAVSFPIPLCAGIVQINSDKLNVQTDFASAQLVGKHCSDFELIAAAEKLAKCYCDRKI